MSTINDLLQESATVLKLADDVQNELNEKDNFDAVELYDLRERVIELLTAVNAYLRRFNEFMDLINENAFAKF